MQPDFSKLQSDMTVQPKNLDYDKYVELYQTEESNPANAEFYPQSYEDRYKYITEFWFSIPRLAARKVKLRHSWTTFKQNDNEYTILELGSNWGTSVKVLSEWYPNATFDLVEFSEYMQGNFPVFYDYFGDKVQETYGCCASLIPAMANEYDFVNASSFFEHLPEEVYWDALKECLRVLKPGGHLMQYSDHSDAVGGKHIRIMKPEDMAKEIESVGFEKVTNFVFRKKVK